MISLNIVKFGKNCLDKINKLLVKPMIAELNILDGSFRESERTGKFSSLFLFQMDKVYYCGKVRHSRGHINIILDEKGKSGARDRYV